MRRGKGAETGLNWFHGGLIFESIWCRVKAISGYAVPSPSPLRISR
jgi:hypothetical protein